MAQQAPAYTTAMYEAADADAAAQVHDAYLDLARTHCLHPYRVTSRSAPFNSASALRPVRR